MATSSVITSFAGLFQSHGDAPAVLAQIEIPLIQRDYAQGRETPRVRKIRDNFLDVLHAAATGGDHVGLDFVYGRVTDGALEPLDGQQRLTTLFLLHWYLAAGTGRIDEFNAWARFSYATRPGARLFCQRLSAFTPPSIAEKPSSIITDQSWYLHVWAQDPTIQSMLVMLDAIHAKFAQDDLDAAWRRLVDADPPAVSFHLLPIEDMGSTDDLYIKMNSRGKPLTEFENFKAQLEKALDGTERAKEFGHKIDTTWADVMWPLRGDDDIVDDEFLRYMRYIIELAEWRRLEVPIRTLPILERAERVFTQPGPDGSSQLDLLFDAFDAWVGVELTSLFNSLFRTPNDAAEPSSERVTLYGVGGANNINLFEACCQDLDSQRFGNPRKLLLYAVLLHLIHHSDDFTCRLRVVRNLVEASEDEFRPDRIPRMLEDVWRVIIDGDLDHVEGFNQAQLEDEVAKRRFLQEHPELEAPLRRLEDMEILRGSLMAFELDHLVFEPRAEAFHTLFTDSTFLPELTGALLTAGDYQRSVNPTMCRFGSPVQLSQWREVLTGRSRANIEATRVALGRLLDLVAESDESCDIRLQEICMEWLSGTEATGRFDWRYYLVKYSAMREGRSGMYGFPGDHPGFSLCMLERHQMNSYYRDPYLLAVARESGTEDRVAGEVVTNQPGPWFTGYATAPRWMTLPASGIQIRCVEQGFLIRPPVEPTDRVTFEAVCSRHPVTTGDDHIYHLAVAGVDENGVRYDSEDRVQVGAALVRALVAAGL